MRTAKKEQSKNLLIWEKNLVCCSCLVDRNSMASHLKNEGNQAKCYRSFHQGPDIARGTLEKVIHPHPQRHAHTWLRAPCHSVWVLYSVFVWVGESLEHTNVHQFLKRQERGGPHPVLTHAECYLKEGWVCNCHYWGVGTPVPPDSDWTFFFCLQKASGQKVSRRNNVNGCTRFHTIVCHPSCGVLRLWKKRCQPSSNATTLATQIKSANELWGSLHTCPDTTRRPRPSRRRNPWSWERWYAVDWPKKCCLYPWASRHTWPWTF